jgi:hypothetical protein
MSNKYTVGKTIRFIDPSDGSPIDCKIVENCKLPGDICIKYDGRIFSYDEDYLNDNAKILD